MLIITAFTIIKRSELSYKVFIFPIFTAVIVSVAIVEFYFLFIVIGLSSNSPIEVLQFEQSNPRTIFLPSTSI